MSEVIAIEIASVNGVALHTPQDELTEEELRQRACTELLRQEAQRQGLLAADDEVGADAVISEAAQLAIERLLDTEIQPKQPGIDECRRYHAAHVERFGDGERVHARHILFAVTPGVDITRLRERAEASLLALSAQADGFETAARQLSNCPSAQVGGDLGWLLARDCAPEFRREVFGQSVVGVLPRLVHSRFGLHIVEVVAREAPEPTRFEDVQAAVAAELNQQFWTTAVRQYLQLLAGRAQLCGCQLDATSSPLVQ